MLGRRINVLDAAAAVVVAAPALVASKSCVALVAMVPGARSPAVLGRRINVVDAAAVIVDAPALVASNSCVALRSCVALVAMVAAAFQTGPPR